MIAIRLETKYEKREEIGVGPISSEGEFPKIYLFLSAFRKHQMAHYTPAQPRPC